MPGLRRWEVAALAGVSIGYYTRLERGRETRPTGPGERPPADHVPDEQLESVWFRSSRSAVLRWCCRRAMRSSRG